jgi:nucleoid-associated protein YgaU
MRWTLKTALTFVLLAAPAIGAQERARSDTIPRKHFPPPGMCRIWLDGVPAERQPAPTDCATAVRNRPTNARVVFNDTPRTDAKGRARPRPSAFRAGSATSGNCIDRDSDGVCDETWARPTEPLPPVRRTGSGTASTEPPATRERVQPEPTRKPEEPAPSREKEPRPREP